MMFQLPKRRLPLKKVPLLLKSSHLRPNKIDYVCPGKGDAGKVEGQDVPFEDSPTKILRDLDEHPDQKWIHKKKPVALEADDGKKWYVYSFNVATGKVTICQQYEEHAKEVNVEDLKEATIDETGTDNELKGPDEIQTERVEEVDHVPVKAPKETDTAAAAKVTSTEVSEQRTKVDELEKQVDQLQSNQLSMEFRKEPWPDGSGEIQPGSRCKPKGESEDSAGKGPWYVVQTNPRVAVFRPQTDDNPEAEVKFVKYNDLEKAEGEGITIDDKAVEHHYSEDTIRKAYAETVKVDSVEGTAGKENSSLLQISASWKMDEAEHATADGLANSATSAHSFGPKIHRSSMKTLTAFSAALNAALSSSDI